MSDNKEIEFKGKVVRCTYDTDEYKVYAVDVDRTKFEKIKFGKYGNASVYGNLHSLGEGITYTIKAIEEQNKYGYGYKVINIKRDKPNSKLDMQLFLSEILTPNQAETLFEVYPDIVDRVIKNNLSDIDLSKTKGIKDHTFEIIKEKIISNFALVDLVSEFQGLLTLNMIKKLYDKYSSVEKVRIELKKNPYKSLCGLARVGFKTADSLLLSIDETSKKNISKGKSPIIDFGFDLKSSEQRCLACVLFLLEENENTGNTKMDIVELKHQCEKLVPACSHYFTDVIKSDNIYYEKSDLTISLKSTYEIEEYIAKTIIDGMNVINIWDFDYEKYRNINEFPLTDEQVNALKFVCKHNVSILNGSAGCVDCDTEFFNGTKWKRIADYSEEDMVLQYNEDGTANLVTPERFIKQPSEYLWHFETKYGLDQCLSDNHNCFYITSKGNLYSKSFKEIKKDQEENINGFSGKFITTFNYNGIGFNLSDIKIRLMVAIIADGSFYSDCAESRDSYYTVRFHLKKDRKKTRLIELLSEAKIEYRIKESAADGYHDIYFNTPIRSKIFTESWYNCNNHQLNIIADELKYWDGSISYKKDGTEKTSLCTTIKENADFIQWVYSATNRRSVIRTYDRRGRIRNLNGKQYTTKSIDYSINPTNRNLLKLNADGRKPNNKTKIEKYKTIDGYEYCFTVPSHMLVLRRNDKIFITGNCGKSATTSSIVQMLDDNNKSYMLLSPTGRAAKVLAEYTKKDASTVHRGLGYMPPEWTYNMDNKLDCDIVIVDEFSMVDIFLFKRVLDAIDFSRTKLIIVGDNAQLSSVACGNLLHDFMQSNIIPTTTLTKIFRYSEGGLMTVATDTRNCKRFLPKDLEQCTFFGDNKDYAFINIPDSQLIKNVLGLYQKLLNQGEKVEDIQVLTAYNKGDYGSIALNNHLQKIANKNYGSSKVIKFGTTNFYLDDLVIQKVNNYKAKVYITDDWCDSDKDLPNTTFIANGEIGKIIEINTHDMVIDFDGTKVKYERNDLQGLRLGYSISIHSSQGGSIKIPILITPKAHTFMLNSNLIYVGLTRMKIKLFHLGSADAVNIAIKKKENYNRKTYTKQLLLNHKNNSK